MAKTITDYQVLSSGHFFLQQVLNHPVKIDEILSFKLLNNFVKGTNRAKPIIQFKLRSFTENTRLVITLNGTVPQRDNHGIMQPDSDAIFDRTFDPSPIRTHYTLAPGNKFFPGKGNKITFSINANQGHKIQIEDVIIWYQIEI